MVQRTSIELTKLNEEIAYFTNLVHVYSDLLSENLGYSDYQLTVLQSALADSTHKLTDLSEKRWALHQVHQFNLGVTIMMEVPQDKSQLQ